MARRSSEWCEIASMARLECGPMVLGHERLIEWFEDKNQAINKYNLLYRSWLNTKSDPYGLILTSVLPSPRCLRHVNLAGHNAYPRRDRHGTKDAYNIKD